MKDEAMKLALGALEDFVDVIKYDNEQDDIGRRACCDVLSYNPHSESCKAKQAITAIKEAIREHAMYEVQRLGQEIEQEPVERDWRKAPWGFGEKRLSTVKYSDIVSDGGLDPRNKFDTPQQRTWVGLTDMERQMIINKHDGVAWETTIAIEQQLKEKNA
jgi:hypothetical protein